MNFANKNVASGVSLVGETGATLEGMLHEIRETTEHVQAIARAAQEQAESLAAINGAIRHVDSGARENAAAAEKASLASRSLAGHAQNLTALLARFDFMSVAAEDEPRAA